MRPAVSFLVISALVGTHTAQLSPHCIVRPSSIPQHLLRTSTGNPDLDRQFREEGTNVSRLFGVTPNPYLLLDVDGPNAYASPEVTRPGYEGTVYFGVQLLSQELYTLEKGPVAVAGILAHEFAHIAQMAGGMRVGNKASELHADLLAGWYLGRKAAVKNIRVEGFARSVYEKGDYDFWSPQHHGTPDERVDAMMTGFASKSLSFDEVLRTGHRYVLGQAAPSRTQMTRSLFNQLNSFFGESFERADAEDVDRIADNVCKAVSWLLGSSPLSAAHVAGTWLGQEQEDGGHVSECPVCTATIDRATVGTALHPR